MLALTVTHAFADRSVGDTITDKAEMEDALASNPAFVVRVNVDAPTPAVTKADAAKANQQADGKTA